MVRRPILETSTNYFKHLTHISECNCRVHHGNYVEDQLYFVSAVLPTHSTYRGIEEIATDQIIWIWLLLKITLLTVCHTAGAQRYHQVLYV